MSTVLQVSLRGKAIFVPATIRKTAGKLLSGPAAMLVANMAKLGYGVSDELLAALSVAPPAYLAKVLAAVQKVKGVHKNWTPLVKDWGNATGETLLDHIITYFANIFQTKGTRLQCGHIIPANTFPLERYNGCPFCGTPFTKGELHLKEYKGTLQVLELWTEKDAEAYLCNLLLSKTALDATQMDSLNALLAELSLPAVEIAMKETRMAVIDALLTHNKGEEAQSLFDTPADILRYLWFKNTGMLQLTEPSVIVKSLLKNKVVSGEKEAKAKLHLHYSRKESIVIARWLNELPLKAHAMCEIMHTKRAMWVRFIRALRLAEYGNRKGFEKLQEVLDKFYNKDYTVWQGQVNTGRTRYDSAATLALLKQRPGLFARSLFSNMLWFGHEEVTEAFTEVIDKVPARLVLTLDMYAENYFDKRTKRIVKPLGGISKVVNKHQLLDIYAEDDLQEMRKAVRGLCKKAVQQRFAATPAAGKQMYIAPELFYMPVAIGDRSTTVQDVFPALMGTRFPVEGASVRLFMQWGTGLPAQHLDMDLSCLVTYRGKVERCSYSSLSITGCKHSGDIIHIPEKTGTAEYIEINLEALRKAKADYVVFTCNAFSNGTVTPNLVVGWMNSRYPMKISKNTGVAYNPAHVQHQVRVTRSLSKGLVFGMLDVAAGEMVWMEIPFDGQVVQNLDTTVVEGMLQKLKDKITIGELLTLKAEAQGMVLTETEQADEVYTKAWATNAAAVTALLID
ncbi:hypothetical protein HNQ91_005399 [Filimonas zeae]|uniref:Prokaryotic RING finger family 4 n=1 Tax=Filimonas zeae TaxID=1737353 RepID=A0A917J302_9BACT|nr:hypothetical protein [Filimonas zeae]MDR6342315.1 hypothetical protein [Filimonas zeae]GGH80840.1 hypothetical protein GCM10011379_52310 [Filimonas zeae]